MELFINKNLSEKTLDVPDERYCEIYKITNNENGKTYIGQAVSHILNAKKYRPYGCNGRFKKHVSEAFSQKKNQSHYLNNAIRKYGAENFVIELIDCCEIENADERETHYIKELDSLYPNGYNLKLGGQNFTHSDESKRRLSVGVLNYYQDKKYERFKNITQINDDVEKYIFPLNRHGTQYGYYVLIKRAKADFGGIHVPLEDSKERAVQFIKELKNRII
jgi:hypothetical protein